MNIFEALKSGKPFAHPEMSGFYCAIGGEYLVHRDRVSDYLDMDFIHKVSGEIRYWEFGVDELLREDWFLVDLVAGKEVPK